MIIDIHFSQQNGGYDYSIYKDQEDFEEQDSLDGGQCDGSEQDALDMALSSAKELVAKERERIGEPEHECISAFLRD